MIDDIGVPVTWSAWGQLSTCSTTCGVGSQSQSRTCGSGTCGTCAGASTQSFSCAVGMCCQNRLLSIDADTVTAGTPRTWTGWSSFGACNVTCGAGWMNSTRQCSSGDCGNCDGGASTQLQSCTAGVCQKIEIAWQTSRYHTGTFNHFSDWSAWGPCSVSCGFSGQQQMTRTCIPGICGASCTAGPFTHTQQCGSSGFSDWSAWSNCSTMCGYGVYNRTRTALGCPGLTGPLTQTSSCQSGSALVIL